MASSSVVILRFNRSGGQASFGCRGWQETYRREECTRSNLGDLVGAGKDFHRALRLSKEAIVDEDGYPARAWTFAQLLWALNSNFAATVCRSGRMPRKCVVFISPQSVPNRWLSSNCTGPAEGLRARSSRVVRRASRHLEDAGNGFGIDLICRDLMQHRFRNECRARMPFLLLLRLAVSSTR